MEAKESKTPADSQGGSRESVAHLWESLSRMREQFNLEAAAQQGRQEAVRDAEYAKAMSELNPPPASVETPKRATAKLNPVAMAVALLKDHPDWSARQLAKEIGCATSTLTRSSLFRRAKALATPKRTLPAGWRDAAGNLEAVDDD